MVIARQRNSANSWYVWTTGFTSSQQLTLETPNAIGSVGAVWGTMTSSTLGLLNIMGGTATGIYYLFATKTGISKVGSYLGTNASQNIDCGFTAGPRFLLIKRTDASGDWYVWDSARGMTTFAGGNDPHLSLNTTAAEVTTDDSIDTYINGSNSGFTVKQNATTNLNLNITISTASYIYLAIA